MISFGVIQEINALLLRETQVLKRSLQHCLSDSEIECYLECSRRIRDLVRQAHGI
jgi:hypothetical protein